MQDRIILVQEEPRGPSQLVEVPVPTNGVAKVVFPDIQQLRSTVDQRIIVKAIRLITFPVLALAPTLGGANAVLTELQKISLVIYCEGWEKAQLLPILTLNDMFVEGSGIPYRKNQTRFNNWENVDWSKTYLQYSNGSVVVGAPYNLLFDVEYIKLDGKNREIIGPS